MRLPLSVTLILFVFATACSDTSGQGHGTDGAVDSGFSDASRNDSSANGDAGSDATVTDGSITADAGSDAAVTDASTETDATVVSDAATEMDAATAMDAATDMDASAQMDAATMDAGTDAAVAKECGYNGGKYVAGGTLLATHNNVTLRACCELCYDTSGCVTAEVDGQPLSFDDQVSECRLFDSSIQGDNDDLTVVYKLN